MFNILKIKLISNIYIRAEFFYFIFFVQEEKLIWRSKKEDWNSYEEQTVSAIKIYCVNASKLNLTDYFSV